MLTPQDVDDIVQMLQTVLDTTVLQGWERAQRLEVRGKRSGVMFVIKRL